MLTNQTTSDMREHHQLQRLQQRLQIACFHSCCSNQASLLNIGAGQPARTGHNKIPDMTACRTTAGTDVERWGCLFRHYRRRKFFCLHREPRQIGIWRKLLLLALLLVVVDLVAKCSVNAVTRCTNFLVQILSAAECFRVCATHHWPILRGIYALSLSSCKA